MTTTITKNIANVTLNDKGASSSDTIGTLPKGWKLVKLKEVGKIETGSTPSKSISEYYGNEVPFFKPTDLAQGINTIKASDNLTKLGFEKSRKLPKGSILVTCIGATIGKTGLINIEGTSNQQVNAIIPSELFNSKFVYYQVISERFQTQIKDNASSTTLPILNKSKFEQLDFIATDLKTQNFIVSKIEQLFSEVDAGITKLKDAQKQLSLFKQSVLKEAFIPKDGENWETKKISEVTLINPKLPLNDIDNDLKVSFLPMRRVEELSGKIDLTETKKYAEVKKGYTPFFDGDVIFAKVTPCMENGKIAIVDNLENKIGFGSSEFHVFRVSKYLLNKYLFYFIVRDEFRDEAKQEMTGAVGLKRVPKQFLENYSMPFPSTKTQQKIVLHIEKQFEVANEMKQVITKCLKEAELLKQSILKQAFEGRLI